MGISQPRQNKTFSGLPVDEKLQHKNVELQCGSLVIDLQSGDLCIRCQSRGCYWLVCGVR
ncbi:hypothetical protein JYQ62_30640 [Nostoc sp. UHCC 0702]|nr:hypothetical protein JYQ62_30640 [Nostoc sp. UHCC 0702]